MSTDMIKVMVNGACGKMGMAVVDAVIEQKDMKIVSLVDITEKLPQIAKDLMKDKIEGVVLDNSMQKPLEITKPDVVVDFTNPTVVYENTTVIIKAGARPVIGTTGLTQDQLSEISKMLKNKGIGGLVAPNFAIGAVLMMDFSKKAAKIF